MPLGDDWLGFVLFPFIALGSAPTELVTVGAVFLSEGYEEEVTYWGLEI